MNLLLQAPDPLCPRRPCRAGRQHSASPSALWAWTGSPAELHRRWSGLRCGADDDQCCQGPHDGDRRGDGAPEIEISPPYSLSGTQVGN